MRAVRARDRAGFGVAARAVDRQRPAGGRAVRRRRADARRRDARARERRPGAGHDELRPDRGLRCRARPPRHRGLVAAPRPELRSAVRSRSAPRPRRLEALVTASRGERDTRGIGLDDLVRAIADDRPHRLRPLALHVLEPASAIARSSEEERAIELRACSIWWSRCPSDRWRRGHSRGADDERYGPTRGPGRFALGEAGFDGFRHGSRRRTTTSSPAGLDASAELVRCEP